MMDREPNNPYAPPESGVDRPRPDARRRTAELAARSAAVVAGFSLLADPSALPGVGSVVLGGGVDGVVLARFAGLALMAAAFLPWRARGDGTRGDGPAEVEEL